MLHRFIKTEFIQELRLSPQIINYQPCSCLCHSLPRSTSRTLKHRYSHADCQPYCHRHMKLIEASKWEREIELVTSS